MPFAIQLPVHLYLILWAQVQRMGITSYQLSVIESAAEPSELVAVASRV